MKDHFTKFLTSPAFYGGLYGALSGGFTGYMLSWRKVKTLNEMGEMAYRGACIGSIVGSSLACIHDLNIARNK